MSISGNYYTNFTPGCDAEQKRTSLNLSAWTFLQQSNASKRLSGCPIQPQKIVSTGRFRTYFSRHRLISRHCGGVTRVGVWESCSTLVSDGERCRIYTSQPFTDFIFCYRCRPHKLLSGNNRERVWIYSIEWSCGGAITIHDLRGIAW